MRSDESGREGLVTINLAPSRAVSPPSETPSTEILRPDPWLSDVCQQKVCRTTLSPDDLVKPGTAEQIASQLTATQASFAFAKVQTGRVDAVAILTELGFQIVDVNLTLALCPERSDKVVSANGVQVSETCRASSADAETHPLATISGECFQLSRFHLDPRFCNKVADRIKHQWIVNCLRGDRGDRIWNARVDGCYAGFLAATTLPERNAAVIDLIGVAPGFQGRGVGGALVQTFLNHYCESVETCLVGTQAANTPSLRLYQKYGFLCDSSAYVLHWHGQ